MIIFDVISFVSQVLHPKHQLHADVLSNIFGTNIQGNINLVIDVASHVLQCSIIQTFQLNSKYSLNTALIVSINAEQKIFYF